MAYWKEDSKDHKDRGASYRGDINRCVVSICQSRAVTRAARFPIKLGPELQPARTGRFAIYSGY